MAGVTQVLMNIENEPNVIKIKEPVIIVGDIHGQFYDMIHMFEKVVDNRNLPKTNMLFLGDYVDRGKQSIEVIILLLCYKVRYPENFFMLRGNHECSAINRIYGFYDGASQPWPRPASLLTYTQLTRCLANAAPTFLRVQEAV